MEATTQRTESEANATLSKLWRDNYAILMPDDPNKDQKSRLGFYIEWLTRRNGWLGISPDLALIAIICCMNGSA